MKYWIENRSVKGSTSCLWFYFLFSRKWNYSNSKSWFLIYSSMSAQSVLHSVWWRSVWKSSNYSQKPKFNTIANRLVCISSETVRNVRFQIQPNLLYYVESAIVSEIIFQHSKVEWVYPIISGITKLILGCDNFRSLSTIIIFM